MSARPGVIKTVIEVPLSRPQQEDHRFTHDFMKLRHDVGMLVREGKHAI